MTVADPKLYSAVVGMNEYGKNQGQTRRIKSITVNPKFLHGTGIWTYDVAVLELDQKVAGFPKVALAKLQDDSAGIMATTAGWGSIVAWYPDQMPPPQYFPARMRSLNTQIIGNEDCTLAYDWMFESGVQLCTYDDARSICQGDSGGPLFRRLHGKVVQLGIASWLDGCAAPGSPAVYTRLSNPDIRAFVLSAMKK